LNTQHTEAFKKIRQKKHNKNKKILKKISKKRAKKTQLKSPKSVTSVIYFRVFFNAVPRKYFVS